MALFQDQDGSPLKFFIQRDLAHEVILALEASITSEGGRVETKVPIKGYILVAPDTQEAARLRDTWTSSDRPERYIVPYSWVETCRETGFILKQIFVREAGPLRMYIHPIIANLNTRVILEKRIIHSGGRVVSDEGSADVVITDKEEENFINIVKHFATSPQVHVEDHLWVKNCIDRGICVFSGIVWKNPGGRRAGDERTSFTEEDETNLCTWIAMVIPYKESGGRTGNKIYQELVAHANEPGYSWVSRHTWQSWRERYKKNAARLDEHIAAIVSMNQPAKGQYSYVRVPDPSVKAPRKKRETRKKVEPVDTSVPPDPTVKGYVTPNSSDSIPPSGIVMEGTQGDPESEWAIKIGNAPPPNWTKRGPELIPEYDAKRVKLMNALHLIDQEIQEIANNYSFLPSEVRAWYDASGDMNATRERFAKARALINALP